MAISMAISMAAKHKSLISPLFRATSQTPSISGFISSWKSSLAGAKLTNSNHECLNPRRLIHTYHPKEVDNYSMSGKMGFVKGIIDADSSNNQDFAPQPQFNSERLDIIHIKLLRNNTFVTITDSDGKVKAKASVGCLEEMKGGGAKVSRFAAEATAEHVGRIARDLGLKSVVMRVNGFTYFKKKRQAILSWKEGYGSGRGDRNPIAYLEDTTRKPHNGCRLRKRRNY